MPESLVECIPNFSEARRAEVVEALMQVVKDVPGVQLLDRHSDLDHNRTVLTFIGKAESVEEAAFRGIQKAAELIDLNHHTGEHPRIGSTDVVPFVPISGISMQECVEMARRLGKRVGDELGIPVYLYEQAATRPERQNLENIRKGQYEALKVEMGVKAERDPDFGPARVGTAGATVIGARFPLIAFNVYLTTGEVEIANQIAKAIRQSSGGLRYVKALGMLVEGHAQVSMNLTNYQKTPLARVVELIRREAARYGVSIHHSELVGLIPQQALVDAAVWYTQMDQFEPGQILENRLYQANQESPEASFLDRLASGAATPGGGSAAAYSAAMAAALAAMLARVTIGKKKFASVEEQMLRIVQEAESLRADLSVTVQEDAAAYEAVLQAYKLPKDTEEQLRERSQVIERATWGAIRPPLAVARKSVEVLRLLLTGITHGNINALSDGGSGAALALASLRGACLNVRVNVASLAKSDETRQVVEELSLLEQQAAGLEQEIKEVMNRRGDLLF